MTVRVDSLAGRRWSPIVPERNKWSHFIWGTLAGVGSFQCRNCDYVVSLAAEDTLPECPGCAGEEFVRASLFSAPGFAGEQPHEAEDEPPRLAEPGARGPISRRPASTSHDDGGDLS